MSSYNSILEGILKSEINGSCVKAINLICADQNLSPQGVAKCVNSLPDVVSSLDQKIAAYIDRFGRTLSPAAIVKLLDILDRISDCSQIHPTLLRLRDSPDGRIQSKAAILLCRGALNVKLIQENLMSRDARVRANAIESTWRVKELVPLLRNAASDSNNRVAGNALLALYTLGARDAVAAIIEMANHNLELFQVTALWVMGETLDAQFAEILRSMAQTSTGRVRWMALRSLGRLKRASIPGISGISRLPAPPRLGLPSAAG